MEQDTLAAVELAKKLRSLGYTPPDFSSAAVSVPNRPGGKGRKGVYNPGVENAPGVKNAPGSKNDAGSGGQGERGGSQQDSFVEELGKEWMDRDLPPLVCAFLHWIMRGIRHDQALPACLSKEELTAVTARVKAGHPLLEGGELDCALQALSASDSLNRFSKQQPEEPSSKLYFVDELESDKALLAAQVVEHRRLRDAAKATLEAREFERDAAVRALEERAAALFWRKRAAINELRRLQQNDQARRFAWHKVTNSPSAVALDDSGGNRNMYQKILGDEFADKSSSAPRVPRAKVDDLVRKLSRSHVALVVANADKTSLEAQSALLDGGQYTDGDQYSGHVSGVPSLDDEKIALASELTCIKRLSVERAQRWPVEVALAASKMKANNLKRQCEKLEALLVAAETRQLLLKVLFNAIQLERRAMTDAHHAQQMEFLPPDFSVAKNVLRDSVTFQNNSDDHRCWLIDKSIALAGTKDKRTSLVPEEVNIHTVQLERETAAMLKGCDKLENSVDESALLLRRLNVVSEHATRRLMDVSAKIANFEQAATRDAQQRNAFVQFYSFKLHNC